MEHIKTEIKLVLPVSDAANLMRVCEAYQGLPMEKREEFANFAEKAADAVVLMEGWADLTEEQRDVFAKAISGLSAGNKIMKEFGRKENEKIA